MAQIPTDPKCICLTSYALAFEIKIPFNLALDKRSPAKGTDLGLLSRNSKGMWRGFIRTRFDRCVTVIKSLGRSILSRVFPIGNIEGVVSYSDTDNS